MGEHWQCWLLTQCKHDDFCVLSLKFGGTSAQKLAVFEHSEHSLFVCTADNTITIRVRWIQFWGESLSEKREGGAGGCWQKLLKHQPTNPTQPSHIATTIIIKGNISWPLEDGISYHSIGGGGGESAYEQKTEEMDDYEDLEEGQEQKVEDLEWGRNQASSSSSLIHHQTPPVGRRTLLLYLSQYLGIASTRKFV